MTLKKTMHVSETKKKSVSELANLIKKKKTILLASIKNLPASQFQEITKKLRGKAIVKVPKKNLIFKAIDESGNNLVEKLKEQIDENVAILFSDLDCFELAAELIKNKSPAKAKIGQEAPEDIEVQAGLTDLVPGPVISELGALGIQIQIKEGKIEIKAPKVIVKKGGKISPGAADIMNKLGIKPFESGFVPLSGFDVEKKKLYLNIKIDRKGNLEKLKSDYAKALAFAVEIGYPTKDTIRFLIGKAGRDGKILEKLEKVEEKIAESTSDSDGKNKVNEKNADDKDSQKIDNEKTNSKDESSVNSSNQSSEPASEQSEKPSDSEADTQTSEIKSEEEIK